MWYHKPTDMPKNLETFKPLLDILLQDIELSEEDQLIIAQYLARVKYQKGDIILNPGEIMKYRYFIEKGCVRVMYLVDGIEISTAFYKEDEFFTVVHSFENQKPSECAIQCIEDCIFYKCSRVDEHQIFSRIPEVNKYARLRLRREVEKHEEIISALITKDSAQRYLNFAQRHPKLLNRIRLKDLASYLNMRPETLSRIRKKMSYGEG